MGGAKGGVGDGETNVSPRSGSGTSGRTLVARMGNIWLFHCDGGELDTGADAVRNR